jgi:enoyl-CoA hydratase/carnithine racemase
MPAVKYEKQGKIAFLTLNRPERLNAIDLRTTEELIKIWIDFKEDDQLWVAILNGEGRSFCAGADVEKMDLGGTWNIRKSLIYGDKKMGTTGYGRRSLRRSTDMYWALVFTLPWSVT